MVDLIEAFEETVDAFTDTLQHKTVGRGVVDVEDPELGPIVEYLVENGYLSDPREGGVSQQAIQRQLDDLPESAVQRAMRETRETMVDHETFMSIALSKCGSDQRTFSRMASIWTENKAEIRGMTESEVRKAIDCP